VNGKFSTIDKNATFLLSGVIARVAVVFRINSTSNEFFQWADYAGNYYTKLFQHSCCYFYFRQNNWL